MPSWIKDDQVREHIPDGHELPARFDDFVRAELPFRIEWNNLDAYGLKPSAATEMVPFLRLSDGGIVAFWYRTHVPVIVYIGGHGELQAVARHFDDFIRGIHSKSTGIPDVDDTEDVLVIPNVIGEPNLEGLPALQSELRTWFNQHTWRLEPSQSPESQILRQRVHQIAEAMIRDGCSKVYTTASYWQMNYRIQRLGNELAITFLDFGAWYPVEGKYGWNKEVSLLLDLVQHPGHIDYELLITCQGLVSIDCDRELLLVPPGMMIE